eukprot:TRINITY_DN1611_c0_g1_i2.p1 TRINITY_DN1611_c0_g1~~TRINITY_DN1611_c0_g1_i2.p1  ORF type:complete len:747 (+),score=244.97 TRINITY_DN1611_c0_g1_i2:60-2300(+)
MGVFSPQGAVLGLDVGDTSVCCACWTPAAAAVETLEDAQGEKQTPCCVHFTAQTHQVGDAALRRPRAGRAERLRHYVGLRSGDVDEAAAAARPEIRPTGPDGELQVHLSADGAALPPQPVSVLYGVFAKTFRDRCKVVQGAECNQIVMAVPPQAPPPRRRAIVEAATDAGFGTVAVLPEPIAALLAVQHGGEDARGTVAVVDVGGTSVVCSIVVVHDGGCMQVAGVGGSCSGVGAAAADVALLDDLAAQWRAEAGRPMGQATRDHLQRQVEKLKVAAASQLTQPALRAAEPPGLGIDIDDSRELEWSVTPDKLGRAVAPLGAAAVAAVQSALEASATPASGLTRHLVVGGGAGLPSVHSAVAAAFPASRALSVPEGVARDECVAVGCGLYGSVLARESAAPPPDHSFLALGQTGAGAAAEAEGGRLTHGVGLLFPADGGGSSACVLLEAGTALPADASQWLLPPLSGSARVAVVEVAEGEGTARPLGDLCLPAHPGWAEAERPCLELRLRVEQDGRVAASCWDACSGRTAAGPLAPPAADAGSADLLEEGIIELRHRSAALAWFVDVPTLRGAYGVSEAARRQAKEAAAAADAAAEDVRRGADEKVVPLQRAAALVVDAVSKLRSATPGVQRGAGAERVLLADVAFVTWQLATAPRQDEAAVLVAALRSGLPLDAPVGRTGDTFLHVVGRWGAVRCLAEVAAAVPEAELAAVARKANSDGAMPAALAEQHGHGEIASALRRIAEQR